MKVKFTYTNILRIDIFYTVSSDILYIYTYINLYIQREKGRYKGRYNIFDGGIKSWKFVQMHFRMEF